MHSYCSTALCYVGPFGFSFSTLCSTDSLAISVPKFFSSTVEILDHFYAALVSVGTSRFGVGSVSSYLSLNSDDALEQLVKLLVEFRVLLALLGTQRTCSDELERTYFHRYCWS